VGRAKRVVALNEIVRPMNAPPPAYANAPAATSQKFSLTIFILRASPEKNSKRKGKFLLGSAQEVSGRSGGDTNARWYREVGRSALLSCSQV